MLKRIIAVGHGVGGDESETEDTDAASAAIVAPPAAGAPVADDDAPGSDAAPAAAAAAADGAAAAAGDDAASPRMVGLARRGSEASPCTSFGPPAAETPGPGRGGSCGPSLG